jgi:hypothetical protein
MQRHRVGETRHCRVRRHVCDGRGNGFRRLFGFHRRHHRHRTLQQLPDVVLAKS